jgi:ribosome-associated protein
MDDTFQAADKGRYDTAVIPALIPATAEQQARELGRLLQDSRGGDVVAMDLRGLNSWTDFFVIATVTSNAHLEGLQRHIKDYSREKGIEPRFSRKPVRQYNTPNDDEWSLVDLGSIVIHLMTAKARAFYELERLWSTAVMVFPESEPDQSSSSSKSSSS